MINKTNTEHKHDLIKSINYKKDFLNRCFKVYTFFCSSCDYERIKEIQISKEDFLNSLIIKELKAQNTTNKTYNQKVTNGK